jgi:hypothetical protein
MAWEEWIDLGSLKALSQHATATLGAFLCTQLLAFGSRHTELSETTRAAIDFIEQASLVGLLIWFVWQTALVLWKGRVRDEAKNSFGTA